ncbi:exonuclease domain-containing protein [Leucobacter chinensis]|uniref:exonuclease domain-containing protein n=1 Tax=Leucobacter chinensis TaxID=2851010 RepID=UPI001C221AE6|nr:exonuclease domain-containing protein [Leucobacter chinensis]
MRDSLPLWAEQIAVFDTETTGVSTQHSRIVTASIGLLNGDDVVERYDWMLDPGVEIPDPAFQVHGISTEMARESGTQADVGVRQIIEQLQAMLSRGIPLVIFNAPYDLTLLSYEAERYGIAFPEAITPVLDPLILDKQLDRYRKGKRTLIATSEHYGVDLSQAHDAGADAIAAGKVLQAIASKYASSLPDDLDTLHQNQVSWAAAQAENFEQFMRSKRDPSFTADRRWPLQR